MRASRYRVREEFFLKAAYSVREIARMAGMDHRAVLTLLRQMGVKVSWRGERRRSFILLVHLQQVPDLWESLLLKLQIEEALSSGKMASAKEI